MENGELKIENGELRIFCFTTASTGLMLQRNAYCRIDCLVYCLIGFGAALTSLVSMPELRIENGELRIENGELRIEN